MTPQGVFLLASIMGAVFFMCFYGTKILDPTYVDWLRSGGDLKQHFMGWEFYRGDAWSFPLGAIHSLAYPFGISVTYMDSIPLFAIPFKVFEDILPDNFQYFGWWGLLCYMLQGGFAALILRRWTTNISVVLLGSLVFLFTPILTARMFSHTALAGHWILLFSIWAFLERARFATVKRHVLLWAGILTLAITVHPYFLPMVALPFALSLIFTHRSWLSTCIKMIVPPVVSIVVFWVIGGFAVKSDGSAEGLGEYAFNLNSLYNSLGWSGYLEAIPNASASGETLNYLGLGMLLLLPVALACLLYRLRSRERVRVVLKRISFKHVLAAVCVLGLLVLSISPRVQFGLTILADVDLPGRVERWWSTFRASARLFWILYYMILVGSMAIVLRSLKSAPKWVLPLLFLIFVSIQMIDIGRSAQATEKYHHFQQVNRGVKINEKGIAEWQALAGSRQHMFYLDPMTPDDFFSLSDIAVKYKLTMNTGYFARAPYQDIETLQHDQLRELLAGKGNPSMLYITKNHSRAKDLKRAGHKITSLHGYYVVN